jgi:hypothetical protein
LNAVFKCNQRLFGEGARVNTQGQDQNALKSDQRDEASGSKKKKGKEVKTRLVLEAIHPTFKMVQREQKPEERLGRKEKQLQEEEKTKKHFEGEEAKARKSRI